MLLLENLGVVAFQLTRRHHLPEVLEEVVLPARSLNQLVLRLHRCEFVLYLQKSIGKGHEAILVKLYRNLFEHMNLARLGYLVVLLSGTVAFVCVFHLCRYFYLS